MDNQKKVALVTGSSRGIGKACVIEFAKLGYNVVINYVNSDTLANELKEYVQTNYMVNALAIKCDISDEYQVKQMVETIISTFGKIDVLVNNAGIEFCEPFEEKSVEHWHRTLNVNLVGTFIVSKYCSKYMLDNKYGKIINIASDSGIDAFSPFSMDYNASKAGLVSLTHDLAIQLQPYINVNCVAPGWVNTDINAKFDNSFLQEQSNNVCVHRIARPEEIAKLVVFLASDNSQYINGETIKIDGGKQ